MHMHKSCIINRIWDLKQHTLQVNGHAWFQLQGMRNVQQAKIEIRICFSTVIRTSDPLLSELGQHWQLTSCSLNSYPIWRFDKNQNTFFKTCIKLIMVWCVHAKLRKLLWITSTLVKEMQIFFMTVCFNTHLTLSIWYRYCHAFWL